MVGSFRLFFNFENENVIMDLDFDWDSDYFEALARVWQLKRVIGFDFIRAGNPDFDGGYITLNDPRSNKIAYSFGISDNVSWDDDMANLGYQIFMYDMTIEDLPKHRPEFHFFKQGIGYKKDPEQMLDTLEHFIKFNGHENQRHMILKMDVEGAEWDFLEQVSTDTLEQFDQLIFEFHWLVFRTNFEQRARMLTLLRKINQTHQIVHLHGHNAFSAAKYKDDFYPDIMEATYVKRDRYEFDDAEIELPIELDRPISPLFEELILGKWNDRVKKF